jgi:hypothetical protein
LAEQAEPKCIPVLFRVRQFVYGLPKRLAAGNNIMAQLPQKRLVVPLQMAMLVELAAGIVGRAGVSC